ncbi:MAG: exodeoxyribonuclease V subunit beta [candidate division Zixibacteria bacterium]|nr:exodeoxyribonuclease V subunit beta [candidate division Zixibacteria bacterium]
MQEFELNKVHLEGTNLIEAGAGTGKTYNIAGLYIRLVLEKRLDVSEILVVTFTKAATEELKDRIRGKLRGTIAAFKSGRSDDPTLAELVKNSGDSRDAIRRLQAALRGFDEAAIFTIHGFCQRMLHDNAFESGSLFDTELIVNQWALLREIVDDFWRKYFYSASPMLINYLRDKKGNKIDSPDKLLKFLGGHQNRLFIKIIPKVEITDAQKAESGFKSVFDKARHEWPAARQEVERTLINCKALKRNIYKAESIPAWITRMDSLLSSDGNNANLFDKFDKFTTSGIKKGTRKKDDPPELGFFELCEDLSLKADELRNIYNQFYLGLRIKLLEYLDIELTKRKRKQNIQFYDDLLTRMYEALHGPNGGSLAQAIRKRYKAALIDEFQDTDPVQYDIFKTIYGNEGGILFLIGDPKQAIYSFRGADIFTYIKAIGQVNHRYTLGRNWRSEKGLIRALNEIFSGTARPFIYDDIPFQPASPAGDENKPVLTIDGKSESPFQIWFLDADSIKTSDRDKNFIAKSIAYDRLTRAVSAEISRLLSLGDRNKITIGERSLQAGDIAILVRTNREALIVQNSLAALNIPCVLHSTDNIFDSHEALETERVIAAVVNPGNEGLIKAALATDMIGIGSEELYELSGNDARWEAWLNIFRDYHDLCSRQGFISMFRRLMADQKTRSRLLAFPDGERRLTNLLHLSEILHQQAAESKLGITALLKWLSLMRNPNTPRIEEHQLRLESDENAAKIITIHKSKGLEYSIVFCPFTWGDSRITGFRDNIFHDESNDNELTLDLGSDDYELNRKFTERELLAENIRLMYVALTRARHRCYFPWGRFNKAGTSAPAYLIHQPAISESIKVVDDTEQNFKNLGNRDILTGLETLKDKADGTIGLSTLTIKQGLVYSPLIASKLKLNCRQFSGDIDQHWRISSFSHLVSGKTVALELPDYDSLDLAANRREEEIETISAIESPSGIFLFPKGAKPGTFCHDLFENLDFTDTDNAALTELVNNKLSAYGYDLSWCETIREMIRNVLTTPMSTGNGALSFSQVNKESRLNELEFYFPLNTITPNKLKDLFDKYSQAGVSDKFPETIEQLSFSPVKGFMKGYIDLVFKHQDKYFIVDWKSNHLGNTCKDYNRQNLAITMAANFYTLQYYIYTVALHKYLSVRLPGYSYNRDFGGVLYIFLRGVDPRFGDNYGIFSDKPNVELIEELTKLLIAERT